MRCVTPPWPLAINNVQTNSLISLPGLPIPPGSHQGTRVFCSAEVRALRVYLSLFFVYFPRFFFSFLIHDPAMFYDCVERACAEDERRVTSKTPRREKKSFLPPPCCHVWARHASAVGGASQKAASKISLTTCRVSRGRVGSNPDLRTLTKRSCNTAIKR